MEENTALHDQNADNFSGQQGLCLLLPSQRGRGPGFGEDDSLTNVFDEEGEEDSGHEDGRGGCFVAQLADAFVIEHEGGVGKELRRVSLLVDFGYVVGELAYVDEGG